MEMLLTSGGQRVQGSADLTAHGSGQGLRRVLSIVWALLPALSGRSWLAPSIWPASCGLVAPICPDSFDDGGLVDLNHVPVPVMVQLLGLSEADAAKVVEARDRIGGFISAEEVIAQTDLSPALVDGIRERLMFVP
jgi:Helix-hairpin-helix motif